MLSDTFENHTHGDGEPHTHEHSHMHSHEHTHGDGVTHTHEHSHVHSHEHDHADGAGHTHTHEHTHADSDVSADERLALLKYMLNHNAHHAEELHELAHGAGAEATELIHAAVADIEASNRKLEQAITVLEGAKN